jgi:hypothetical protein
VYTGVEGKFCGREVFGPIFLMFVTEKTKVLLNFLIIVLNFAITLEMIGSSETSLNITMLVEYIHKLGHKL